MPLCCHNNPICCSRGSWGRELPLHPFHSAVQRTCYGAVQENGSGCGGGAGQRRRGIEDDADEVLAGGEEEWFFFYLGFLFDINFSYSQEKPCYFILFIKKIIIAEAANLPRGVQGFVQTGSPCLSETGALNSTFGLRAYLDDNNDRN